MKKALVWAGAAVAVLLFTWGAVVAYRMWYDRKVPNFAGVQHVYVYPDMSPETRPHDGSGNCFGRIPIAANQSR